MKTGDWITLYLGATLFIFVVWEVLAWVFGKTTMSQRIIHFHRRYGWVKVVAFLFSFAVAITGIWLTFHWELI